MADKSKKRRLGKSELFLTPLGLGTWQFSKRNNLAGKFWSTLSDEESYDIIETSFKNGINWYDTAELYGGGESERTLTRGLQKAGIDNNEVVVATKWWPVFRWASNILKTIEQRKEALKPYTISLHQVHMPFSFSSTKAEMQKMKQLVEQGDIKYIGVSNFSADKMKRAYEELDKHGLKLISNQVRYSLLDRKIEKNGILKTANDLGVSIIAYSPLAQGVLTGKYHQDPALIKGKKGFRKMLPAFKRSKLEKTKPLVDLLEKVAHKYESTPAQVSLNWLINYHGENVFAIPGASNTKQAESNANAMKLEIDSEDINKIAELSAKVLSS